MRRLAIVVLLSAGMLLGCSAPATTTPPDITAGQSLTTLSTSTASSGQQPVASRRPPLTFHGDDASFVAAVRTRLAEKGLTTSASDTQLVDTAKMVCSITSSGGAIAAKIDYWGARRQVEATTSGVIFLRALTSYCPDLQAAMLASRAEEQRLGDAYLGSLTSEAQVDLVRFILDFDILGGSTTIDNRSDAQIQQDAQASCAAWKTNPRLAAVESAVTVDATEPTAVLDIYLAGLIAIGCSGELDAFLTQLTSTPMPANGRHT